MYIFVLSVNRVLLDLFLKGIIKWRNKYVVYNLNFMKNKCDLCELKKN